MNEAFRSLTVSNVSEAALSSAMDVLDDKWSVSDDGSNAEGRRPEVLELLQPGTSMAAPQLARDTSSPVNSKPSSYRPRSASLSLVAETTTELVYAVPASVQDSQQGDFSRQSSAASDFSQSSGSNWSQCGNIHSKTDRSRKVQLHELIGRGAFGSVHKGTWKNKPAAIKIVEHDDGLLGDLDELDDFVTQAARSKGQLETSGSSMTGATGIVMEAAVSSAVMHPNVVQTYSYHTQQSALTGGQETYVVMEWCGGGSLEEAVAKQRFCVPTAWGQQPDALTISVTLLDIACGMAYLHQMHIVHRDLKLKNVLLKLSKADWRGFTAKVADFGLSQLIPETSAPASSSGECNGTVIYMAPEVLAGARHTTAADVFAFGIMMYELWGGQSAYSGMNKMQIMYGVTSSGLRPRLPQDCPAWYSSLAVACWAQSPARRPSFTYVAQHFREVIASLS